jgi:AcrB/AcrD/AcrF family
MGLAVIFIYIVLASQFGSFIQPIAIMASLPLALIGVMLALLLWRSTLNVFSMIGLVMLMGLVTKNAILLVDFAKQMRKSGSSVPDALLQAGLIRMRPIVMSNKRCMGDSFVAPNAHRSGQVASGDPRQVYPERVLGKQALIELDTMAARLRPGANSRASVSIHSSSEYDRPKEVRRVHMTAWAVMPDRRFSALRAIERTRKREQANFLLMSPLGRLRGHVP